MLLPRVRIQERVMSCISKQSSKFLPDFKLYKVYFYLTNIYIWCKIFIALTWVSLLKTNLIQWRVRKGWYYVRSNIFWINTSTRFDWIRNRCHSESRNERNRLISVHLYAYWDIKYADRSISRQFSGNNILLLNLFSFGPFGTQRILFLLKAIF